MRIPDRVKIGGLTYTVTETPNITLGREYGGEIFYETLRINIRPVGSGKKERIFLHEVLHGIFDNLGYTDHDEKKIDELAGALYALIVDNPDMFKDNQQSNDDLQD